MSITPGTAIPPTSPLPPIEPGTRWRVRRLTPASVGGAAGSIVLVLVLALVPYLVGISTSYAMIDLFIYVILATSWNLLAGFGGMVSIGQQAYLGLGAYGLVVLADELGISPFLALPIIAIVAGLIAIPISFLAFRLVGGYFAVGTWVIAEVFRLLTIQVPGLGGGAGTSLSALSGYGSTLRVALGYWVALICAVAVVAAVVLLARSRLGLALTAVRDEPVAAATSGVNVTAAKRIVFIVAGACAGIAGALVAFSTLNVQPDDVYDVQWSAFMIFIVVIGGTGTIEGPIIGAVVFWVLKQLLADYGTLYLIGLGVVGVLFVLFLPNGIWGLISRRRAVNLFPIGYRLSARK